MLWFPASKSFAIVCTAARSATDCGARRQTRRNAFSTWHSEKARLAETSTPRLFMPLPEPAGPRQPSEEFGPARHRLTQLSSTVT